VRSPSSPLPSYSPAFDCFKQQERHADKLFCRYNINYFSGNYILRALVSQLSQPLVHR